MRLFHLVLIAAIAAVLVGCGGIAPQQTAPAVATVFPTTAPPPTQAPPSPTPAPSATPLPTDTPLPTETPVVTPTQVGYVYVFPVQPPSVTTYVDYHHDYPANDILAPLGTTVVAVTNGVIEEVNYEDRWDPATDDPAWRGGRFISIIGDDGIRYYGSHMSALVPGLAAGQRVQAGQPLGAVGQAGDAAGTDPHLHFGISHPTFPGDWSVRRGEINPYPYLQAWQEGQNVTPVLDDGGLVCSAGMLALPPTLPHAKERASRYGQMSDPYVAGAEGSGPVKWTIGHSVNGRAIDVYRFGRGSVPVAIVGGIHGGFEGNTVRLTTQLVQYLQLCPQSVPVTVTLYIVPNLNPDGLAYGAGEDARLNGNGVDLNRNWDYRWQEYYDWMDGGVLYGGAYPFSEPETQSLRDFLMQEKVQAVIFYHSMGEFITYPDNSSGSGALAHCFSDSTGYEVDDDPERFDYQITGDSADYLSRHGFDTIDIELSDHVDPEWDRNLSGVLNGLPCWLEARSR